jgi:hypothetical protein
VDGGGKSLTSQDEEHLQLLSVFHFVVAAFAALFALFPVIHFIIGIALMMGALDGASSDTPPAFIGLFFVLFSGLWILFGLVFAICLVFAGRYLRSRKNYTFCLVIAGLSCMFMPFGTVLGVFTIIVLMRESVRLGFGLPSRQQAS